MQRQDKPTYYEQHKDKQIAYSKAYYQKNKEKILARKKQAYDAKRRCEVLGNIDIDDRNAKLPKAVTAAEQDEFDAWLNTPIPGPTDADLADFDLQLLSTPLPQEMIDGLLGEDELNLAPTGPEQMNLEDSTLFYGSDAAFALLFGHAPEVDDELLDLSSENIFGNK